MVLVPVDGTFEKERNRESGNKLYSKLEMISSYICFLLLFCLVDVVVVVGFLTLIFWFQEQMPVCNLVYMEKPLTGAIKDWQYPIELSP